MSPTSTLRSAAARLRDRGRRTPSAVEPGAQALPATPTMATAAMAMSSISSLSRTATARPGTDPSSPRRALDTAVIDLTDREMRVTTRPLPVVAAAGRHAGQHATAESSLWWG